MLGWLGYINIALALFNIETFVNDFLLRTGHRCFLIAENGAIAGLITPNEVKGIARPRWPYTTVRCDAAIESDPNSCTASLAAIVAIIVTSVTSVTQGGVRISVLTPELQTLLDDQVKDQTGRSIGKVLQIVAVDHPHPRIIRQQNPIEPLTRIHRQCILLIR